MHNPATEYVDIGVNLLSKQFKAPDEMLKRASQAGIVDIIAIAGDSEETKRLGICSWDSSIRIWTTAGIHPHHAESFDDGTIITLRQQLNRRNCIAIGECGLDFNRLFSSKESQLRAFNEQLELAVQSNHPLYLHQRDAHDEFMSVVRNHALTGTLRGVVHCFTENKKRLRDYLDLGFYVGVTGWLCDERRGHELRESLPFIPSNRLLVETDAPYLKPRGYEGTFKTKRNEPCLLPFIVQTISQQLNRPHQTIAKETKENAYRLFGMTSS